MNSKVYKMIWNFIIEEINKILHKYKQLKIKEEEKEKAPYYMI